MIPALIAALLAAVAVLPSLYRRWRDGRTIARLRVEAAQAAGERDVAVATVEAAREVAADQAAGRAEGEAVRAAASEGSSNPLDKIRAADRERARIAAARQKP